MHLIRSDGLKEPTQATSSRQLPANLPVQHWVKLKHPAVPVGKSSSHEVAPDNKSEKIVILKRCFWSVHPEKLTKERQTSMKTVGLWRKPGCKAGYSGENRLDLWV